MERIKLEFPKMTKLEIDNLDNYFSDQKFHKLKKKAIMRDWWQEKLTLKNLAEDQIISQVQKQIDSIALERNRLETVYFP